MTGANSREDKPSLEGKPQTVRTNKVIKESSWPALRRDYIFYIYVANPQSAWTPGLLFSTSKSLILTMGSSTNHRERFWGSLAAIVHVAQSFLSAPDPPHYKIKQAHTHSLIGLIASRCPQSDPNHPADPVCSQHAHTPSAGQTPHVPPQYILCIYANYINLVWIYFFCCFFYYQNKHFNWIQDEGVYLNR